MRPDTREPTRALSAAEVEQFIRNGVVGIRDAFPRAVAEHGRAILWRDTGCDPEDPATWTRPVVRLGLYGQGPFVEAANTSTLHAAYDQLVGPGRWQPRLNLGTFPVRFPSREDPGDSGWHIDPSFEFENPDFLDWRANIKSKGRALLMLFLFSDVGPDDAPTRIRVGSHLDIARRLAPAGERGLSLRELAANDFSESGGWPAGDRGDGRGGNRLFVSSISRARRPGASRRAPAIHGPAAIAAGGPLAARRHGWSPLAG